MTSKGDSLEASKGELLEASKGESLKGLCHGLAGQAKKPLVLREVMAMVREGKSRGWREGNG